MVGELAEETLTLLLGNLKVAIGDVLTLVEYVGVEQRIGEAQRHLRPNPPAGVVVLALLIVFRGCPHAHAAGCHLSSLRHAVEHIPLVDVAGKFQLVSRLISQDRNG